jgi:TPR repeat protein
MKITFTTAVAAFIVAAAFGASAIAGPFEDGIDAARRADYETVLRLWRPLAEQGDARAQTAVGRLYAQGRGVPRDYAAATGWYRKAAEQGDDEAHEALARLHADVPVVGTEPRSTVGGRDRAESDRGSHQVSVAPKRHGSSYGHQNQPAAIVTQTAN